MFSFSFRESAAREPREEICQDHLLYVFPAGQNKENTVFIILSHLKFLLKTTQAEWNYYTYIIPNVLQMCYNHIYLTIVLIYDNVAMVTYKFWP